MSDGPAALKLLVDEDLSPKVAQRLRDEDAIDAIGVRDRGKLGATDREVLDLAFDEDRILVTANVDDFRRLATARELHPGIVLMIDGDLARDDQLVVIREAIAAIESERAEGRDMVNRALHIGIDGTKAFEALPVENDGPR